MNLPDSTHEHLRLIRGRHWNRGLSPAELQRGMTRFHDRVDDLTRRGVHRGAQPLVEGLTRAAAATYARYGIRVNCVAPGLVQTPLSQFLTANEVARKASVAL